jgi:hypothetical protein
MANQITASQYRIAKQTIRNKFIKINLLNFNYLIVDTLEGNAINGNININASSDIRRTCNISFVLTNSSFDVQAGGRIWLDKLVQIYVGIQDTSTSEISWNNMGIFLINKPTYNYNISTKTMSFDGVDLMAKMTGLRNGYIKGINNEGFTLIPAGSNVRNAIIAVLKENGFNNYYVSECLNEDGSIQNVPYDMKFEQGSTWYNILNELRNILPNYQIYFDSNGVFRYEKIPYSLSDPIMIDDDIWANNIISEQITVNFENVKNVVEIFGRVHKVSSYSDSTITTIENNIISPSWTDIIELTEFSIFGFSLNDNVSSDNGIYINFLNNQYNLVDSQNNSINSLEKDKYYVISYQSNGTFLFLGGNQAYAIWKDENPESPFFIGGDIGEINIPLYGEDYDNIMSDDLALQRAKYEIYKRCRLNDSVNLTVVPIYWADVNWKISHNSKEYMIQTISTPLTVSGTQTIKLIRFYPLYPII